MMNYTDNPQLQLAYNFLEFTNQNVFLTGKAGTGKTTFLQNLRRSSPKRMVILAPTGVAAINAGGATIHSFFQMPFGPQIPEITNQPNVQDTDKAIFKLNKTKINIIKTLDLLVIDEISMVRADLLDGVDTVLRRYRNTTKPFGGIQLLLIGDLQQLAPVVKDDEWSLLKDYYDTAFFFSSKALRKTNYITVELKHIYRQSDQHFIEILNKVRNNSTDQQTFNELNKRYIPGFTPNEKEGYITLTTHNYQSNELNQLRLNQIKNKPFIGHAVVEGNFPAHAYPTEMELVLKKGAQVMFVKNDSSPEKLYFNGKIGKITRIEDDLISVKCPGDTTEIIVGRVEWQNMSYTIDNETKEIKETVEGKFIQYPLKLAWAITIHKSQGLTFEKVVIDAAQAFSHGQVYVALSRCKTLEGIVLSSRLDQSCLRSNSTVNRFNQQIEENPVSVERLDKARLDYELELLHDLFSFDAIQARLFQCNRLFNQFSNYMLGQVDEIVKPLPAIFKTEIVVVAENFKPHLTHLIKLGPALNNSALNERIAKACPYFIDKLQLQIIEPFKALVIESDNKEIVKDTTESVNALLTLAVQKVECLTSIQNGFDVKDYLTTRAKSLLKTTTKESNSTKKEKTVSDKRIKNPKLFAILKDWRDNQADELNIPEYFIFAVKPLIELANQMPDTITELQKIKGIGKSKANKFGAELLEIIRNFKSDNKIQNRQQTLHIDHQHSAKKEKPEKKPNHLRTFELYNQTHSIDAVVEALGISRQTVIKHLSHYVQTKELDINKLVEPHKINLILDYFKESDSLLLKPAKEILGEAVSYDDLHLVASFLKQETK